MHVALFSPRFLSLVSDASAAGAALAKALGAVKPPTPHAIHGTKQQIAAAQAAFNAAAAQAAAEQAAAIDVYDAKVVVLLRRLRRLRPPAVMTPVYRTELQTLLASRKAGAALAARLRTHDRSDVAELGRRFTLATRRAQGVQAQRAQNAAIKAYDRRVGAIGALSRGVQDEVARLRRAAS